VARATGVPRPAKPARQWQHARVAEMLVPIDVLGLGRLC
jgi:hypothetical protein